MQPSTPTPSGLPEPDSASLEHSIQTGQHILAQIREAGGYISFAEFMQSALYAPGFGYYSAGATKFGEAGDFVTAPEISPLFARVLARQCAPIMVQLGEADILELGAGSGALAVDLLTALAELGQLPRQYLILEVSPDLRERQEQKLREAHPNLMPRISWLDSLPDALEGIIVGNEVADALPVERFRRTATGIEQYTVVAEGDSFAWQKVDAPARLAAAVTHIETYLGRQLPDDYDSELCLALPQWIKDIAASLKHGFIFLFDYGLPRHEYYAPDRSDGTLRCHYRHRAHSNPLILPGIQDITAWVDFTAIAEAATDAGLSVDGFVSQAHFLMSGGLEQELAHMVDLDIKEQLELSRQVKTLTLPGEMGETFKCIGLSRGKFAAPSGFAFADRTHIL
jgi:SAM-dependent MidA family methyltransferase